MVVFEKFELAPGLCLDARVRRGAVHVLVLESDDLREDFLSRYLADLSGHTEGGEILLEEVRDERGQPRRLRELPPETIRGFFARFVGFMLRDGGLIETLTIRENLLLPFRFAHIWPHRAPVDDAEVARRVAAVLDFPDAPDFGAWLDRPPAALSVAQRRLAGLVCTYARQPDLVIAFTPLAGLDARARATITACVRRFRVLRPDCAHLFVLHHRDELRDFAAGDVVEFVLSAPNPAAP